MGTSPESKVRRSAFTMVELLVAIAIIGMLIAILLPSVQSARESARRISCANNQKQLGLAILQYQTTQNSFPPGRVGCDDTGDEVRFPTCKRGLTPEQKTAASGFVELLPNIEQQSLYDQLSVSSGGLWNRNVDDLGWYESQAKRTGILQRPELFVCPSDASRPISDVYSPVRAATGSYALSQGTIGPDSADHLAKYENDGMFVYVNRRVLAHIKDGHSNTYMVGEVQLSDTWESSNTWSYALANSDSLRSTRNALNTRPGSGIVYQRQNGAFGSYHPGGANFVFADGHVEFETDDIQLSIYRAKSTIRGDEDLDALIEKREESSTYPK